MSELFAKNEELYKQEPDLREENIIDYRLPWGCQVISELKRSSCGKLYLASYNTYELHTAVSCLIQPQEGDRVRATVDQNKVFVTDILHRTHNSALNIDCGERKLSVSAAHLILNGGRSVEIKAEDITLRAKVSHWIAERMHQMSKRWFVKADDAWRKIKYSEDVQARNISCQAEEVLSVKGKLTAISGSTVVKVDGSQIHMG
ncbi:hypothetical protein CRM79_22060 [Pantoea agglomerans]|nr:DUF3540 domain-containing protein [Pantoea agglomerans]PEI02140.1 hypothetical protein CRM79_22060 [Pantoea agglomerans]